MNRSYVVSVTAPNGERTRLHCDGANLRRKQEQQTLRYQLDVRSLHPVRQSHTQLKEETR